MTKPPVDPKIEAAAAILRGAVSAVPFVGGLVAEVGNLYLNPLEKRKQQWMEHVGRGIEEITKRTALSVESLQNDEGFISFLYQATIVALKNHQREKIDALRNAIVGSVKSEQISEDLKFQFLQYIDDLSVTHLSMLTCLNKHAGQFADLETLEEIYQFLGRYMGVSLERGAFRVFLNDLEARFLIRTGDLKELPEFSSTKVVLLAESSAIRQLEVTPLGLAFLSFINGHES